MLSLIWLGACVASGLGILMATHGLFLQYRIKNPKPVEEIDWSADHNLRSNDNG